LHDGKKVLNFYLEIMKQHNMKIISSIVFFLYSFITVEGNDGYKRNYSVDILNYNFSISVNDTNNIILGHSEITLHFVGAIKTLAFDLKNKSIDGRGMSVQNVSFDKGSLIWTHIDNKIIITFTDSVRPDTQGIVSIDYSGVPGDGLIISDNKFGMRTFFADNWPDRARNWLPCIDHPYDKATVDFKVTSPDHYEVVGSGQLVEESCMPHHTKLTHWKEDVPLATKVMAIGIANFASRLEGNINGTPVWSWVFAENRTEGFNDYSAGMKPLAFYCKLLGPYEKLANVQSKTIFGGLENAGCIFYSENSVTGKGKAENLMAHEIAHQWFGNSVTENDWHHIWLSEGFATYLTAVYQEKTYGKEKFDETMKTARDSVISLYLRKPGPIVDTTVTDLMKLLNHNTYQKGAWVLHMLRRELGDEVFWQGMKSYYEKFRDKNALTIDFQREMEKASRKDLNSFFKQWLFVAGQPDLKIKSINADKKGFIDIIIEQTQNRLFSFDIELQIKDSKSSYLLKIPVSERITIKTIKTQEITEIIPDPNTNLLFRLILPPRHKDSKGSPR
jgi:aminopeptidase N